MGRTILHCDLNNFFASVECRKFPELNGQPVAVCGDAESRHGIILAKNEVAKKFGVQTAEVIWQAKRKCPNLILLPPHMNEYIEFSLKAREIYSQYTDLIESFGIDECWLDVTGSELLFGSGEEIANKLRLEIKERLGLTISVGVSFNKVFAKLGSDMKKPDAVTVISKENFKEKIWNLPANDMLSVGKKTALELQKYGIRTIGDIANSSETTLTKLLGKNGVDVFRNACGLNISPVAHQSHEDEIKSIGHSSTTKENMTNSDEVWRVLYELTESVTRRLRKHGLLCCSIQITVKDSSLQVKEFQTPLSYPTRQPKTIGKVAIELFKKKYDFEKPVRLIGIRAINLISDKQSIQYTFSSKDNRDEQLEILEGKVELLRERFGDNAIKRASLLNNLDNEKSSPK